MPPLSVLRLALTRVIPVGLALGASMEVFMFYTGFWDVALRKAAERELEARATREKVAAAEARFPRASAAPE